MHNARLRRLFRPQPTAQSIERMGQVAKVQLLESAAHFWMWDAALLRTRANSGAAEARSEPTMDPAEPLNAAAWAYKFLTYEAAYLSVCNEYSLDSQAVFTHALMDVTRMAARRYAPTLAVARTMDLHAPTVEQAVAVLRAILLGSR